MLFNSPQFLGFVAVTFVLFQALAPSPRTQRWFLVAMSCLFYYCWELSASGSGMRWQLPALGSLNRLLPARLPFPRGLVILLTVGGVNFAGALASVRVSSRRTRWAIACLVVAITIAPLLWFKYSVFVANNLAGVVRHLGGFSLPVRLVEPGTLFVPLGISFFTFQMIAYTVDVYREPRNASKSLVEFGVFAMLFSHLAAGPIMRGGDLLPQVQRMDGSSARRIAEGHFFVVRGLLKKVVLGDLFARVVDPLFLDVAQHSWFAIALGTALYSFQIYFDFSGYSDIAVGSAKYFGFDLRENFRLPYFSRSPREFWTRWHMTLMAWFRDYVYEPLGGNVARLPVTLAIVVLTFALSGLWHGASWTFVLWGTYHGVLVALGRIDRIRRGCNWIPTIVQIGFTFVIITAGWLLFRIHDLHALRLVARWSLLSSEMTMASQALPLLALAFSSHGLELILPSSRLTGRSAAVQAAAYAVALLVVIMMYTSAQTFVYFQF